MRAGTSGDSKARAEIEVTAKRDRPAPRCVLQKAELDFAIFMRLAGHMRNRGISIQVDKTTLAEIAARTNCATTNRLPPLVIVDDGLVVVDKGATRCDVTNYLLRRG